MRHGKKKITDWGYGKAIENHWKTMILAGGKKKIGTTKWELGISGKKTTVHDCRETIENISKTNTFWLVARKR